MPIYGYQCDDCGHRYDRLQKLSEDDPTQCPECQSSALRRQISAPSFRLAGSGWYETDFKKDGDTKRNLVDSGSKSDAGDSSSGGKAEAKSDSKSDSKADSTTSGKSDGGASSKPDAKSDSKPAAPAKSESKPAAPSSPSSGS